MKGFWTPPRVRRLKVLWACALRDPDAWPTRRMAATLGCTRNAIIGKAGRLGLPPHPLHTRRLEPPNDGAIARLYRAKLKAWQIADALGIRSESTVFRALRRAGVKTDRWSLGRAGARAA